MRVSLKARKKVRPQHNATFNWSPEDIEMIEAMKVVLAERGRFSAICRATVLAAAETIRTGKPQTVTLEL